MSREPALRLVHDGLARYHDLPFLPAHELTPLLTALAVGSPAEAQRRLLGAIEQLRPPSPTPGHAARWRQYHYLRRRYLDGVDLTEIQAELALGDRQARRVHHAALQALAVALGLEQAGEADGDEAAGDADPAPGVAGATPDDILASEVARLDLTARPEAVDLGTLLAGVLRLVEPLAARRGVRLGPGRPAWPPIVADRALLRQLLLNVVTGLIGDGPVARLAVGGMASDDVVVVELVAHAAAAPPPAGDDRGLADDRSPPLTAAGRLAEHLGARLELGRAVGELRARLTLSRVPPATVLVVDDNPDIEQLFRRFVQGVGYRIIQACDGTEALRLAAAVDPAVVVLDLMLPLEDGWSIFDRLRRRSASRRLPILACSVLPQRELALALGVDGFLAKPVTRAALLTALRPYRAADPSAHPGLH